MQLLLSFLQDIIAVANMVHISNNVSPTHQFELMVDGNSESIAFLNLAGLEAMQPVVISALLQLKVGQKVSINRVSGGLFQVPKTRCTCFSSSFFTRCCSVAVLNKN